MPRASNGVYTLPESPFVAGTVIQSTPVNSDFSDIAAALTTSLATTGVSTMTGPIKAAVGVVTAPSYTFGNALGTGWYLAGANQIGWAANGVVGALFNADGTVNWAFDHTFADDIVVGDNITSSTIVVSTSGTIAGHPITNFPSTTAMPFNQTSAPTGWTKSATNNDKALRVTTGTVSTGGSVAFSTLFARTAVDNYTLISSDAPTHAHNVMVDASSSSPLTAPNILARIGSYGGSTNNYEGAGSASTANVGLSSSSGGGNPHLHAIDMRLQYVDVIIATKN